MVSGTISLFCSKCFSPFLHSTGSLSVSREYLALPDGPGRFTQNSSCSALLRIPLGFAWLRIRSCHALWLYFPEHSAHQLSCHGVVLQPHPCRNMDGLGCSPFARHYWGNHCLFSFPAGTKMFQFPALFTSSYVFTWCWLAMKLARLPHLETCGSLPNYDFPQRFAVICVLHQL